METPRSTQGTGCAAVREERTYRVRGEDAATELVHGYAEVYGLYSVNLEVRPLRLHLADELSVTVEGTPDAVARFWSELDKHLRKRFSVWDLLGP